MAWRSRNEEVAMWRAVKELVLCQGAGSGARFHPGALPASAMHDGQGRGADVDAGQGDTLRCWCATIARLGAICL